MDYVYTSWCLSQHTVVPILEIRGSCVEEGTEGILLRQAVQLIERAERFKGIPYTTVSNIRVRSKKEKVIVKFALIFPNEQKLERFVGKEFD